MNKKYLSITALVFLSAFLFILAGTGAKNSALTVPENLSVPVLAVSDTSVTLIWEKPKDYSKVTGYDIMQETKVIASTDKLNYTVTGLTPATSYSFTVRSKDAKNIQSTDSNKLAVTTLAPAAVSDVTKYGAVGDGKTLNTKMIQKAIDECAENGKVVIPEGIFLSGALFLKSNMTLEINGTLLGSDSPDDYPFTSKRFPYYETDNYTGLVNAYTLNYGTIQNVKICGNGTINGGKVANDPTFTELGVQEMKLKSDPARGDLITIKGVTNLYIGQVKIINPAEHTIFISYSKNITIDGIDVRTYDIHNADGVDFAVSDNIKLFNSFFDTGDDCINFNAGLGNAGVKEAIPCSNIRVFNCKTQRGHGGVVFGSFTAAWIKNVLVEDCEFNGTDRGIRFKTSKSTGGGAENIIIRDITMKNIKIEAIIFDSAYSQTKTEAAPESGYFRNITIQNVVCEGSKGFGIYVKGLAEMPNTGITFNNITLNNTNGAYLQHIKDSTFNNIKITGENKTGWTVMNTSNLTFKKCTPAPKITK